MPGAEPPTPPPPPPHEPTSSTAAAAPPSTPSSPPIDAPPPVGHPLGSDRRWTPRPSVLLGVGTVLLATSLAATVLTLAANPPMTGPWVVPTQVTGGTLTLVATVWLLWPTRTLTRQGRTVLGLGALLTTGLTALLLPASVTVFVELVQIAGVALLAPSLVLWIIGSIVASRAPGRGAAAITTLGILLMLGGLSFGIVGFFAELMLRPESHRVTVGLNLVNPVLLGGFLVLVDTRTGRPPSRAPVGRGVAANP